MEPFVLKNVLCSISNVNLVNDPSDVSKKILTVSGFLKSGKKDFYFNESYALTEQELNDTSLAEMEKLAESKMKETLEVTA